jgi:tetratricopeptide (TPR) repeat protein
MRKELLKSVALLLVSYCILSCAKPRVKSVCNDFLNNSTELKGISIDYPEMNTLFPADFQAPTFRWTDSSNTSKKWFACISDTVGNMLLSEFVVTKEWKPDSGSWESLKHDHIAQKLKLTVVGYSNKSEGFTGSTQVFQISPDSVGADIFFRAVTLPFSYAVRNVHTIEWYMGSVQGGAPRKMLDKMPVCANCHSFSPNGPILAMDVDYGNDKGSYALARAIDTCSIEPEDIISWGDFKKDEGDPTFGLLSQISPSGRFVLSTVKDLSVFAAVDNNLAYSQLFFPIKGIIGIYDVESRAFSELQGANDPKYVQSNPVWSPDSKKVLFARTDAYVNEKVKKYGNALLNINDVKEFKKGNKEFKFDLYSVDFNEGTGGTPIPLKDASFNGKSNYFPKYSPDGKWIVFCQAENFMLLQPDSKLFIMKSDGTEARLMNCNRENMNSWHSWSPNGRWLVFSSKEESLYTRLYLTHIDENGNDSPPILLENLVFEKRAANIPEFFPGNSSDFAIIKDDFSNSAPYFTRLATDNMKSQYYLRAHRNLTRAIDLDPNYVDAYILKTLLNSILQQVNSKAEKAEKMKALSVLDDQIAEADKDDELKLLKANLLISTGDYDQAEKLLHSIISKSPRFYRAYDLLATIYKKKNMPEQVIRMYQKMIELIPSNELEIGIMMARYHLSRNNTDAALAILKDLSVKHAGYDEIHAILCSIYTAKKDIRSAQYELNILLANDSSNYSYYFMQSEIAELSGNKEKALEYYRDGMKRLDFKLQQNRENIPLAFEKAGKLANSKDMSGALVIYDDVLKDLPANYQALKEKARIMLMTEQWQNAIRLYDELSGLYNPEEEFYNNGAIACLKIGNYEEALNKFSSTLIINPSNLDALYNRYKLNNMLGNSQKASQDLENIKQVLRKKENLTAEEKQLLNL